MNHYNKDRDNAALGKFYTDHVSAMTREGLHAKSDIASELAVRDAEIAELRRDAERNAALAQSELTATTITTKEMGGKMNVTADQMHAQVEASIRALELLTKEERAKSPSRHFGENYNRLLSLSQEAMGNADARRWPMPVDFTVPAMDTSITLASYVEIYAYLGQIVRILRGPSTFKQEPANLFASVP